MTMCSTLLVLRNYMFQRRSYVILVATRYFCGFIGYHCFCWHILLRYYSRLRVSNSWYLNTRDNLAYIMMIVDVYHLFGRVILTYFSFTLLWRTFYPTLNLSRESVSIHQMSELLEQYAALAFAKLQRVAKNVVLGCFPEEMYPRCACYLYLSRLFLVLLHSFEYNIDMRPGLPASQDRSERTASLAASTGGRAALISRGVRQVTKRTLHVR